MQKRCSALCSHHIFCEQALVFPLEKTKAYMLGMSTLLSPFVAAMSPVPPLLKCKIRPSLISGNLCDYLGAL